MSENLDLKIRSTSREMGDAWQVEPVILNSCRGIVSGNRPQKCEQRFDTKANR